MAVYALVVGGSVQRRAEFEGEPPEPSSGVWLPVVVEPANPPAGFGQSSGADDVVETSLVREVWFVVDVPLGQIKNQMRATLEIVSYSYPNDEENRALLDSAINSASSVAELSLIDLNSGWS